MKYPLCHLANSSGSGDVTTGLFHRINNKLRIYIPSDYFLDKSDNSDIEDLHDCISKDRDGGCKPDSCYIQPYLFEADDSEIED